MAQSLNSLDTHHLRKKKRRKKRKSKSQKRRVEEGIIKRSNSESSGYEASDNEVESDLESTARSGPKCKEMEDICEKMAPNHQSQTDDGEIPDIAAIIAQQLQNILPQIIIQVTNNVNNTNANGGNGGNGGNNGCTYKGFLACNPRDYDGKGGAVALTRWIEKMESVIENSGCAENQKVKYAASSFINKALTWWNTQVQARGREAAIGMTWAEFKALLVEGFLSHKLTTMRILFDYGVDFSFISTKFAPLLNVKPSIVISGYVIEVANDLISLGHGSFDVIVGMDWLSKNKVVIVCHEKVVRIPLEGGEILRVQGERTFVGTKTLMSTKADELELSDIPIVRDFTDVFVEFVKTP
ncbi:hypothetical protein Tco_0506443 [Tanacetum coccineum]